MVARCRSGARAEKGYHSLPYGADSLWQQIRQEMGRARTISVCQFLVLLPIPPSPPPRKVGTIISPDIHKRKLRHREVKYPPQGH